MLYRADAPVATLPTRIEEIDAAWLSTALDAVYPGAVVTSLTRRQTLQGSATKVALSVTYNDIGGDHRLPAELIVKGGFGSHAGAGAYLGEARFYSVIAPQFPAASALRIPACCYAAQDPASRQAIVVLEDLSVRGVRFGDVRCAESVETARRTLAALAVLHARWWKSAHLGNYPWLAGGALASDDMFGHMLAQSHWDACMRRERASRVPAALLNRERVLAAVRAMAVAGSQAGPPCLLHGDPHLGNLYFEPDGTPGFLDWQTVMKGPWVHDVTYNLIGLLDIEDRRAHERDLLRHYLDCLRGHGVEAPSFDSAWRAYRGQVMHGFLWLVCPRQMQPEPIVSESVARFAAAAEDLGTFDLLLGGTL